MPWCRFFVAQESLDPMKHVDSDKDEYIINILYKTEKMSEKPENLPIFFTVGCCNFHNQRYNKDVSSRSLCCLLAFT